LRIVVFGLTLSSSWGNGHATPWRAIIRGLHAQGHEVSFFEKDVRYYAKRRDFSDWPCSDLVLYESWDQIRRKARAEAAQADAVIFTSYLPDGAKIIDELFDLPRSLKIFYDLDTPITLNALRAAKGRLDYLRSDQIPDFDLYLSFTGGRILDELRNVWKARKVAPLYGCVDPDTHYGVELPGHFRCFFSYMGTYAPDRQAKLDELFVRPAAQFPNMQFFLAGSMYPENVKKRAPKNIRHFEHVSPKDHPALYSSSRATLNITRAEMAAYGHCPSGRLFEAAACGTPLLSDRWDGLDEFFAPGEELVLVESAFEVITTLKRPDAELAAIGGRAKQRTLEQHTGARRAEELVDAIEDSAQKSRSAEVA
jgi:spore maturation protein CgeB